MKKIIVNRMIEETAAMIVPILDMFADAVNHIIIDKLTI